MSASTPIWGSWDYAPCGSVVFDDDGLVLEVNDWLLGLLGLERSQVTTFDKLLSVPARVFHQTHFFPLLKLHSKAEEIYLTLRAASGQSIPVLTNARRLQQDGVHVNWCILLHIPQRSRFEEELLASKKAAEAATLAKEEFLALISHELRTPLNSIMGWAQLLRSGELDGEGTAQAVETIERSAKSQAQLIEDILDFTRISSGKLRLEVVPVDLVPIVHQACEIVRPTAEARGVALHVVTEPQQAAVHGDEERLQQVLWNLLSNAIKFTPKGGAVHVRLHMVNSSVEIVVQDTGQGMAPEFLPYVFDRFRQAEDSAQRQGGLGLGMAITRDLVELHGGTIRAHSPGRGQGSQFTVSLPVLNIHVPEKHVYNDASLPVLEGLHLLVVDDQPDSRKLLSTVLTQRGARVSTASSAAMAFDTVTSSAIDLLISDIEMPGGDGHSLLRRIRSSEDPRIQKIPAIALTANARFADRMRALAAGFQIHVTKPVQPQELLSLVANLSHGR